MTRPDRDRYDRDGERAAAEAPIRAAATAGDHAGATTAALRLYGTELLLFLRALANDDDLASEAFAELGEDLWSAIATFRWEASLRSWLYMIARNALNQLRRDPRRRPDRNVPLSLAPELEAVNRTATLQIQRTEVKDEFRALRAQLDPEEHELLLLRLDRQLAWKEIAQVLGGDADVSTRAAALRKRFERAKDRLRKLAVQRGLIGPER
ncbi:MAG: RNA polymerase sigma factor [Kofleriaceae bacterium]